MRKLSCPSVNFSTSFTESIKGISNANKKIKYTTQITNVNEIEMDYISKACSALLYSLPRVPSNSREDPLIQGTLKKSDLMKLYTQYFSRAGKPAREIYNKIKITANGKCPFCGEIGYVSTLDHFVPKANFPLYSVLPANLVPCCRDCNSEKNDDFSETIDAQTLHPYFDNDKYFTQKWVWARVISGVLPVIEYYVLPPDNWEEYEQMRVFAHFAEYGLAKRFSIEAGADIPEIIMTRKTTLKHFSPLEYSEYLREKSENTSLPINNWRRVMFYCLANDGWFCSNDH